MSATIIDLDEIDRQILGYDPHEARRALQKGSAGFSAAMESAAMEIAEAKSLVRNARRAVNAGQRESARSIYALAIEKLGRYDEAGALLAYARAEVARELGPVVPVESTFHSRRAESSVDNGQVRP